MNKKKKPTPANKKQNSPPKDFMDSQTIQDEVHTQPETSHTEKIQNHREDKGEAKWLCSQCLTQWTGIAVGIATALFAFLVYRQAANFFLIEKKPYLQLSDIRLDSFETGQTAFISFKINNLGESPTKVIGGKSVSATRIDPPLFTIIDSFANEPNSSINQYIIRDAPIPYFVEFRNVTDSLKYAIEKARYSIFVWV